MSRSAASQLATAVLSGWLPGKDTFNRHCQILTGFALLNDLSNGQLRSSRSEADKAAG